MKFEDPAQYNLVNEFPIRTTKEVLQEFKKYIRFGEKDLILDVGSGSGNVTAEVLLPALPHPNFRLIGVDILEMVVEFANNHNKDPRVSFRVVDMIGKNEDVLKSVFTKEELNPGFDLVFSNSCIQWTGDHEQCLKNIFSLMRPGGQAFLWFVGHCTLFEVWQIVGSKEKWHPYLKSEFNLKFPFEDSTDVTTECTDLLKRIGFEDVICDCAKKPLVVSLEPWRKCMECIDPQLHKIPEHLRSEYMGDVMDLFYELFEKTNGFPYDRIVVIATKPNE